MNDVRDEIDPAAIEGLRSRALDLAAEARSLIRQALSRGFTVKRKPDRSYVTSADLLVEQRLRALIQEWFPDHGVLGEEFPPWRPDAPFQWIFDPIDGTEDFVQRVPTFGSIIALHYHGQPLVGVLDHPHLDLCLSATHRRGTFRDGARVQLGDLAESAMDGSERLVLSARANFTRYRDDGSLFDALTRIHPNHRIYRTCYAHALAVIGAADAAVDWGNRVWDLAATRILVEEAGGTYATVQRYTSSGGATIYSAVFGRPALVARLVAELGQRANMPPAG